MRILFFGSSSFSIPPLQSIRHFTPNVVTRKAKPKGRGYLLENGEVAQEARRLGLPLVEVDSFKEPAAKNLAESRPDLLLVVSFGLIIPKWFLEAASVGAVNVHPSLLPRYRGPAPIQWAIKNGECETGVTIIRMSEKMDAGDILYQERHQIGKDEDAKQLSERLSERTAEILPEFTKSIETNGLPGGVPQREEEATYTPMITKEMGMISWAEEGAAIVWQVRAFVAWPTAYTFLDGKLLKIFAADVGHRAEGAEPGTVLEILPDGLLVASLGGSVLFKDVQLENRRRMKAAEFARGYRGIVGKKFT